MVERPIKKSERQSAPAGDSSQPSESQNSESQNSAPRSSAPPVTKRSDRTSDRPSDRTEDRGDRKNDRKGKRGDREESKQPVNLALMRGPKPVKSAAPALELEPEAVAEENPEETAAE